MTWYDEHRDFLDGVLLSELAAPDRPQPEHLVAFDSWAQASGRGEDPGRMARLLSSREAILWSAIEDTVSEFVRELQHSWGGTATHTPWPVLDAATKLSLAFCRAVRRSGHDVEAMAAALSRHGVDPLEWVGAILVKGQDYLYPLYSGFANAVYTIRCQGGDAFSDSAVVDLVRPRSGHTPAAPWLHALRAAAG